MSERLKGKVAIITGGARGMGASHGRILSALGAKVVLTDVEDAGAKVAESIGENALFMHQDVSSPTDWAEVIRAAEAHFGPIAILVNNAGIAPIRKFEDMTPESLNKVLSVNCVGSALGMQAVIPSMKAAGGGSIINISSVVGLRGAHATEYCISKFAITGMTKAAAISLGKYGIRVNSVHPGFVDTDMAHESESRRPVPLAELIKRLPLARMGTVTEISYLVAFLASDESTFCTGAEFTADGGQLCQV